MALFEAPASQEATYYNHPYSNPELENPWTTPEADRAECRVASAYSTVQSPTSSGSSNSEPLPGLCISQSIA